MRTRGDRIRVGLVGCGEMGRSLARQLVTLERAELVGVCDIDPKRAGAIGQEFSVWVTTELEALLDRVEAVIVATPGFQHAPVVLAAARAGKHVFCEKPLALTLKDCDQMIAACKENKVVLMVGHVCRYHPLHALVHDLVIGGHLGRLLCLTVHRISGPFAGPWQRGWRKKRMTSGGMLMEVNVHELDFLRWVGGEVATVYAVGENFLHPDRDYPDCVLVTLRFRSGALGFLHTSHVSSLGGYGGRVDGERGSLLVPSFWGKEARLILQTPEGRREVTQESLGGESPVRKELQEFLASVREGRPPAITGEDGRAAVELVLAAYQSLEKGEPISLPL